MQRSKIKDRMDLTAVYRLLGIPKKNLMAIFAIESVVTTVKYGLPAVAVTYATINILSKVEVIGEVLIFPLWGALLTFAAIALFRLVFAVIPVISINRKPPARLAADYDF
jgi:ABC-type antimicrobial peptide transport system permease subunit